MANKPFLKTSEIEARKAAAVLDAPERPIQAFSVIRRSGGWVMLTYTIQGDQIVSQTASEPDLKMMATEAFKIAAYRWWTSQ